MNQQAPVINTTKVRWSSASADDQFAVQNPATGQVVAVVHGAGPDEADRAVRDTPAGAVAPRARLAPSVAQIPVPGL